MNKMNILFMVNEGNKFRTSESKVEQEQIKGLLAKYSSIKVIQSFKITVSTYKQKMVEFGK